MVVARLVVCAAAVAKTEYVIAPSEARQLTVARALDIGVSAPGGVETTTFVGAAIAA